VEQAQELVKIMRSKDTLTTLCGLTGVETELDFSSQGLDAGDAVLIANDISDMRALTKLDISKNSIGAYGKKEGWIALAATLKANTGIRELNIAKNILGNFGPESVIIISDAIKDMGALSSANLLGNSIPVEQAEGFVEIMRSKENLTTLCGLSREETELDFSDQDLGPGDAVLIANEISDMEALTSLDISSNMLSQGEWTNALDDSDGNNSNNYASDMSGVIMLADAIKDMKTLTSLDLRGNRIGKVVLADGITYAKAKSGRMLYWKDHKSLGAARLWTYRYYCYCQCSQRDEVVDQARHQQKFHRSCAEGGPPAHLLGQRHRAR
jgi:Leucine-rich repeat (LRR) protein